MSANRAMRRLATATVLAGMAGMAIIAGCSTKTDLGGAEVPNALPDTRITATPPSLRDAVFVVRFFWSGSDPDGKIRGFQWKISDNGTDGISLRDTLTIDPATGDTLHPWHSTTTTDSTFIVTADLPDFPEDGQLTDPRDHRSYQTHTIFVRAVDDQGGVDPTPAMVSFTATTIAPTIIVDRPASLSSYKTARSAPPTLTFGWSGSDPDFEVGVPTKVRYMWKKAVLPSGEYCVTQYDYDKNVEYLCSFSDSAWSDWMPYKAKAEERTVTFRAEQKDTRGRTIGYLFAIQAQDTAGAVSPDRTYARNVHNLTISYIMTPALAVRENYLGEVTGTALIGGATFDIAQNQPLNFSWTANADAYAGTVTSYRYGWDVSDPTNENDPGWALQPGDSPQHHKAPQRSFSSGTHTLTVQATDNSGQLTRIIIVLNVVPVPQPDDQLPLLIVDDVYDSNSQSWVGIDGRKYDNDVYRDAFWLSAVTGGGGVVNFIPARDVVDLEVNRVFGYRDVVNYRSLIWEEKKVTVQSYAWNNFDPRSGDKFIWLGTYQQQVGHVLLAGESCLNAFIGDLGMLTAPGAGTDWMVPIILDTTEGYYTYLNNRYALGSGTRTLPDGTTEMIGKTRYPYSIWGVDVIDQPSSLFFVFPGPPGRGRDARKTNCAGLKGLVLDPSFKAAHLDPGAIADTIMTWRTLETTDYSPPLLPGHFPNLRLPFLWGQDEFYDTNVTARPTAWLPQTLPDGRPAVEPMFRILTRYEWIRQQHVARGDPGWPLHSVSPDTISYDKYNKDTLRQYCSSGGTGSVGYLFDLNDPPRTKVDGAPVGLLSHKTELTKPTPGGDVVWGFDPSRFDPNKIRKAIQWVLGEEFHLRMVTP